jgi:hypothetical protein
VSPVGHALGHDGAHAEESPVRQARDEPHGEQGPISGRQGGADVARDNHGHQDQQDLLQGTPAGDEHDGRGADADAQRIGRNQVSRHRDRHAQLPGDVGQNTHHHEFGHAERQRAESQRDQTLFHTYQR